MIIDDDHMDHLLFSEKGIPHAYVPDHAVEMAFLGSNTAGDWAVGDFWGPLGNETRAWLDHLATGAPTVHTTPEQARINLETTIAIERAVASGHSVRLPLQIGGVKSVERGQSASSWPGCGNTLISKGVAMPQGVRPDGV